MVRFDRCVVVEGDRVVEGAGYAVFEGVSGGEVVEGAVEGGGGRVGGADREGAGVRPLLDDGCHGSVRRARTIYWVIVVTLASLRGIGIRRSILRIHI